MRLMTRVRITSPGTEEPCDVVNGLEGSAGSVETEAKNGPVRATYALLNWQHITNLLTDQEESASRVLAILKCPILSKVKISYLGLRGLCSFHFGWHRRFPRRRA